MQKKIYFIVQGKGGAGKSLLAFMLAEKYQDAVILDLDDAIQSTKQQLAYRNPTVVPFLDPKTKSINRGTFMELFQSIALAGHPLYIADLGGSVSEQLPKFFILNSLQGTLSLLQASNIHLQLVCVVGGGNIFKATMTYLDELVESTKGAIEIVVAHNGMYPCTQSQQEQLQQYVLEHTLPLIPFDLAEDKNESAMRNIETVLKDGQGLASVSPFISIYFIESIKKLNL
ncbi:hypothetical protein [Chryseolinea lacunae]|uniref:CobQ/CobB/MinD/ParA nucleotide binding domain-containing protein n=1 Tax=Chryseolinea lacunae TaxID=2801331 RepID=A0ABS1KQV3_9BACT|nr:hypothetical protein [Chryseolinea lacunae]MBL0741067.1 hypothetical protein [Chryseolinea lacunae]